MRAISKTIINLGKVRIPIAVYSAVDTPTSLNRATKCCNSLVRQKLSCLNCSGELTQVDTNRAYNIGTKDKPQLVVITKEELETIEKPKSEITIMEFIDKEDLEDSS